MCGGIVLMLLLLSAGCRYEEGPFLNFTKVEKRIRGMWSVSTVYKDGEKTETESPTPVETLRAQFEFYKNKILVISYLDNNVVKSSSGSWEFGDKKKTLNVAFQSQYTAISRQYEIIKFKNRELKVRFTDDKGIVWTIVFGLEYSFVPYDM
jgi:hypothetical protein